jgi:hypothetical protein
LFALILGFLGPFLPELIGIGRDAIRHKQEIELRRLSADIAEKEWKLRIAEIETKADVEFALAARQPQQSFGIQLLDAALDKGIKFRWLAPVFYLFALADWLVMLIRPGITAVLFAAYLSYKYAIIQTMAAVSDPTFTVLEGLKLTWTPLDTDLVLGVIGFWFGIRTKASGGGSTSSSASR